jgi:hypothetical protein
VGRICIIAIQGGGGKEGGKGKWEGKGGEGGRDES